MTALWRTSLTNLAATEACASALANNLCAPMQIWLQGDLGAGKTAFARALLQALGVNGAVRSPTFSLLEPYSTQLGPAYHLDLYRVADPEELHLIGIEDLFAEPALVLVEWPLRGQDVLPSPDLVLALTEAEDGDSRVLTVKAHTEQGERCLRDWQSTL